jgi:hypothetical protein
MKKDNRPLRHKIIDILRTTKDERGKVLLFEQLIAGELKDKRSELRSERGQNTILKRQLKYPGV